MGLRGPAPKSRDRKVLEGTFRKDRDAGATITPTPLTALPKAPSLLSAAGKAEWRRMGAELIALGVLSSLSLSTLEAYCAAYAKAVQAEKELKAHGKLTVLANQGMIPHPCVNIAKQHWAEMRAFAAKLGIAPADHTRVRSGKEAERPNADPWAGLANG